MANYLDQLLAKPEDEKEKEQLFTPAQLSPEQEQMFTPVTGPLTPSVEEAPVAPKLLSAPKAAIPVAAAEAINLGQEEIDSGLGEEVNLKDLYKRYVQLQAPKREAFKPSQEQLDSVNKAEWFDALSSIAGTLGKTGINKVDVGPQTRFGEQEREKLAAAQKAFNDAQAGAGKFDLAKLKGMIDVYKAGQAGQITPAQMAQMALQREMMDRTDARSEANRIAADERFAKSFGRLEGKENQRQDENLNNFVRGIKKDLVGDKVFQKAAMEDMSFDQVDNLLKAAKSGNRVAFSAVGTKMAKAMGEVGALTQQDISHYVQAGALDAKAADILSKWASGKPSKDTLNDIGKISKVLKEIHEQKIGSKYDEYANLLHKNSDLSQYESYDRLSIPIPSKLKKAKQFFDKNKGKEGIETLKDAENYLMQAGKL